MFSLAPHVGRHDLINNLKQLLSDQSLRSGRYFNSWKQLVLWLLIAHLKNVAQTFPGVLQKIQIWLKRKVSIKIRNFQLTRCNNLIIYNIGLQDSI